MYTPCLTPCLPMNPDMTSVGDCPGSSSMTRALLWGGAVVTVTVRGVACEETNQRETTILLLHVSHSSSVMQHLNLGAA